MGRYLTRPDSLEKCSSLGVVSFFGVNVTPVEGLGSGDPPQGPFSSGLLRTNFPVKILRILTGKSDSCRISGLLEIRVNFERSKFDLHLIFFQIFARVEFYAFLTRDFARFSGSFPRFRVFRIPN